MSGNYDVYLGNQRIGKVQVIKQGLYYRFICRCRLDSPLVWRLYAFSGDKRESLGVLIPIDDGFGLETSVPVKRFGGGKLEFILLPKHETGGKFIPIQPEEPFGYIERLKDGYLAVKDGHMGLELK